MREGRFTGADWRSTEVAGRAVLDEQMAATEARFAGADVPKPPFWGGYLITPLAIEFWQGWMDECGGTGRSWRAGRTGRLHDRLRFERASEGAAWSCHRLSP